MRSLESYLSRGLGVVLAALLAALVILAATDTLAWAVFEVSWAQASEISGLLLVWFGLLGAAYGIHGRVHLGVEIVTRRLSATWQSMIGRLAALLVAVFGGLLAVYGAALTAQVTNTLPATGLSASVQYLPAVVAGGLMVFFALHEAIYGVSVSNEAADD